MRRRHDDRGAVDPILVIASITVTLILLVAGAFNVGDISRKNADDAAKNDLRMLAAAEKTYFASQMAFTFYDSTSNASTLTPQGLQPSTRVAAAACGDGWVAAAKSSSGAVLTMTSKAPTFGDQSGNNLTLPSCASPSLVTSVVSNVNGTTTQAACPTQQTPLGGLTATQTTSGTTTTLNASFTGSNAYSMANTSGYAAVSKLRLWIDGVQYCSAATGKWTGTVDMAATPVTGTASLALNLSALQSLNPSAYSRFLTSGVVAFTDGLNGRADAIMHL
ncbi:hypothetical protein [Curtobacterium sp. MCSS17_016]|uniref:hypothetical protein n=1 Tax=Curtobacterium sp. MCSS17_016 TaxID=2175644 RepID=UPI0015E8D8AE|nr:hypothetical protein [Curtobacterium sp. MCSS17_016]WIE81057.1 hypothetical protein DEJ19_021305 [Curtobacterium sp. MCSS17_016]